jgi:lysozyme family protein
MVSKAFDEAIKHVLANEGGYVNDPKDPGGETKYGICKRQYPKVDIKNLTLDGAKEIYYVDYWKPYFYDSVDPKLAGKVFDTAINIGPKKAFILLQNAANKLGANLVVDGSIGPKSIESINKLKCDEILSVFRQLQAGYYRDLVVKNRNLEKFLKGWIARANR